MERCDDFVGASRKFYHKHTKKSNHSGMLIGHPIAIEKITAEGTEERRAFNHLFPLCVLCLSTRSCITDYQNKNPFIDQDYFNFRNCCPVLKGYCCI